MDRRAFLATASAVTAGMGMPEELGSREPDVTDSIATATVQQLIALLDDDRFAVRQGATTELIMRGRNEIRKAHVLSWKRDIQPLRTHTREVRGRLEYVIRELGIEEARLSWNGTRVPLLPTFEGKERAPAIDYFSTLNAAIGGNLDAEKLTMLEFGQKMPDVPDAFVGRPGESLWETLRRNAAAYTVWDNDGALTVTQQADQRLLASDGALCGKLCLERDWAMVFFLTDPAVKFGGYTLESFEAVTDRGSMSLAIDASRSGSTVVTGVLPEGLSVTDVSSVTVRIRAWGSPVIRESIDDFSAVVDRRIGRFRVIVYPPKWGKGPDFSDYHHVYCNVSDPSDASGECLPNHPKQFFSSYATVNGMRQQLYPSDWSGYERLPGGAEFLLRFPRLPTRMDIRLPDDRYVNDVERTLRFDVPKKVAP